MRKDTKKRQGKKGGTWKEKKKGNSQTGMKSVKIKKNSEETKNIKSKRVREDSGRENIWFLDPCIRKCFWQQLIDQHNSKTIKQTQQYLY
jgi:hypothetical protein